MRDCRETDLCATMQDESFIARLPSLRLFMTYSNCCLLFISCLLVCRPVFSEETTFEPAQLEFFEKKIRPILVERCQECHGAETQEASLRLDSREFAIKGGDTGPAVVPGKVNQGELLQALKYDPDGYQMPPDGKLPQKEIDLLTEWVKLGAPWPADEVVSATSSDVFNLKERAEHWSFQPLKPVELPNVDDSSWTRNGIDHFVLQKLQSQQLSPAQEVDRRTWIRRVYLDVIGLPPSIQEVEDFLSDESDRAFEKVVDHLLESPHFGERWGRHWLDVVRYAESRGHEFDFDVANAWHYRDYVIRALNADVPFDQFVVEHVAGDLLTAKTNYQVRQNEQTGANESIIGTGFWLFGEWVHSPVDIRQEEAERFDNMIDVYSKAFLGLTVSCARCHDHKFDPIRQKDYYALQGFLQSSSYQQARFETMLKNEPLSERLNELDRAARQQLQDVKLKLATPVLERLDDYLLAARVVLQPETKQTDSESIVFEDFESGTYGNWTVTGEAFGSTPVTQEQLPAYQGDVGATGKFLVNSHYKRENGKGDRATGTLTSKEFTIQHRFIEMLIGGGSHIGKTCVNLLIDGQPVLSVTGKNSNSMSPVRWDVTTHIGRIAQLQIVDNEQGGWGNIGVDQIVFSSHSTPTLGSPDSTPRFAKTSPAVRQAASEAKLNPSILATWANDLSSNPSEDDPLILWSQLCVNNEFNSEKAKQLAGEIVAKNSKLPASDSFDNFFTAMELIPTGPGYRYVSSGSDSGQIEWNPLWDRLTESKGTQGEPGALQAWKRSGRLLRTPTFDIASGKIYSLVRGQVNTYAAVDSHILVRGPLHKKLTKTHPANENWHWITHDVTGYEGHGAHLEFVPVGKNGFAVQAVIQADRLEDAKQLLKGTNPLSMNIAQEILSLDDVTLEQLVKIIQKQFQSSQSPQSMADINRHPQLFGLSSKEAKKELAKTAKVNQKQRDAIIEEIEFVSATTPALLDGTASDEYVFIRGNWTKKGETVPRRFLEVFHGESVTDSGSGRLQLAEQMVDPKSTPILPRVIVNRIWHHYFGVGICPTPNDFGHLGQRPFHPELLDWLANELVKNQWSLKAVHRKILLSATYRMSSATSADPRIADVDPKNVLLHRMNVKRLEGEAIRDSILKVAGTLNSQMYGPSVPIHLTAFLEGRGRPSESGPIDGNGHRSLYLSVRRNFPEPFFQAFDFPNPHSSTGRRNVSNVPAQALALMNNPLVVDQSQKWAERLLKKNADSSPADKMTILFQQAYSRLPSAEELALGKAFLSAQAAELKTDLNAVPVWTDYCHVLLNSKEFIFVK